MQGAAGAGSGPTQGRTVNLEPKHTDIRVSGDAEDSTHAHSALSQVEIGNDLNDLDFNRQVAKQLTLLDLDYKP